MPEPSDPIEELAAEGRLTPEGVRGLRAEVERAERRGASRTGRALSWTLCSVDLLLCVALGAVLPWLLSGFKAMFAEMQLGGMPQLTTLLLAAPGWSYSVVLLVLAAALLVKEIRWRATSPKVLLNAVALVLMLCSIYVTVVGLFLPMMKMVGQLSEQT